jgi:ATP-dependent Lhr-like helicase
MFAADLLSVTRMLAAQLNDVLGELVSHGLVTADGFAGLRALVAARSSSEESTGNRPRLARRRVPLAGSGRWSMWRRAGESPAAGSEDTEIRRQGEKKNEETSNVSPPRPADKPTTVAADIPESSSDTAAAHWAWQLLRRWGVVFRDLLEREPGAPRWFELLQVLRRLEARGEIRGGRFISGVAGEQFALGDTVRQLRKLRDEGPQQELVVISAADPLNLVGILTPHARVTSNASNRIAWLDGVPVAALVAREVRYVAEPNASLRKLLHDGRTLLRHAPVENDDETPFEANGVNCSEHAASTGNPADSPPAKRRAQKSLFPKTIPRPFIR